MAVTPNVPEQKSGVVVSRNAGADLWAYRIVKSLARTTVVHGAAASDAIWGIVEVSQGARPFEAPVALLSNGAGEPDRVDIVITGIYPVVLGGTVSLGDLLTSDAEGKAVVASPGDRIIGQAMDDGVAGRLVGCLLMQGVA